MLTILLDENLVGFAGYLHGLAHSGICAEFAEYLSLRFITMAEAGLPAGTSDLDIWSHCQAHDCYLLTDNRNEDGPDSFEAILRAIQQAHHLPIFTIGDLDRFRTDGQYARQVVECLLGYLINPEQIRGAGRLFVP